MKHIELSPDKLFYTIGEVANMFEVNTSLIRFWEKEFSVIKPKKNAKGNRLFTAGDIENFKLIYFYVKELGMTLKGAQKKLSENKQAAMSTLSIADRLTGIKSKLLEIHANL